MVKVHRLVDHCVHVRLVLLLCCRQRGIMRPETGTVLAVPRCAAKMRKTGDLRDYSGRRQRGSRPADPDPADTGDTETEDAKGQEDQYPGHFRYRRHVGFALR